MFTSIMDRLRHRIVSQVAFGATIISPAIVMMITATSIATILVIATILTTSIVILTLTLARILTASSTAKHVSARLSDAGIMRAAVLHRRRAV